MEKQDSIFTKIIRGEIPCYKIYEDESTFAFLDVHPITDGHILVVPKVQIDHLWDLNTSDYQAVMETVRRMAELLRIKLQPNRVGLKVIGLDVPHAHVHVIPFDTMDDYRRIVNMDDPIDHQKLAQLQQQLVG